MNDEKKFKDIDLYSTKGIDLDNLNAKEHTVYKALSDEKWDFRTVDGICKETGLPPLDVTGALKKLENLGFARKSLVSDRNGNEIYTLGRKPRSRSERFAELRMFTSKLLR